MKYINIDDPNFTYIRKLCNSETNISIKNINKNFVVFIHSSVTYDNQKWFFFQKVINVRVIELYLKSNIFSLFKKLFELNM